MELEEALEDALRDVSHAAVERLLARAPRGFDAYVVPIDEQVVRTAVGDLDVDGDWGFALEVASRLAVERLRELQRSGRIAALDTQGCDPRWRSAARTASHPLLRLLADAEFGAALASEVEAALAEARMLPGWDERRPALVRHQL